MRILSLFRLTAVAALIMSMMVTTPIAQAQAEGEVVAEGFNGPMGVLVAPDGSIWVIDSGLGGDEEISAVDPNTGQVAEATTGETAQIVQIAADGSQSVAANLISVHVGEENSGGSRLALLNDVLYATNGNWIADAGPEAIPGTAAVLQIADGEATIVAEPWMLESDENPDGALIESHPYGLAAGPDGYLYVADAGANTLLRVDPVYGDIELVATFDPVPGVFPNPARDGEMLADPVPTGVAFDADGNIYVSFLTGVPFVPGNAKVVQVDADGNVSDYATGLTMLTDLRTGPDGELYATQFAVFTDQGPTPDSGAVIHIHEGDGSEAVVEGLSFPTSLDFDADGNLYVTINGVGAPGSGAVVKYEAIASMHDHGAAAPEAEEEAEAAEATEEEAAVEEEAAEEEAAAEEGESIWVAVGGDEAMGDYLVDANGMTLYLFLNDEPGVSNCYDNCAVNWPPLLATGEALVGEGIDESLVGTTERTDGTTQVTYNGWPLYYWKDDVAPGDATGQGRGDVWYVLSPAGEMIETVVAAEEEEAAAEEAPAEEEAAEEEAAEAAAAEDTPSVTVSDQDSDGTAVTVDSTVAAEPGWMVIHADADSKPGPVIGKTAVAPGATDNVIILLDEPIAGETPLWAMLHIDAGQMGVYEFPGADAPAKVDDAIVMAPFTATAPDEAVEEAAEEEAATEEEATDEEAAAEEEAAPEAAESGAGAEMSAEGTKGGETKGGAPADLPSTGGHVSWPAGASVAVVVMIALAAVTYITRRR